MRDSFIPLKLFSKFSKSLTVTYLICLDLRNVADVGKINDKTADLLSAIWDEGPSSCKLSSPPL